MKVDLERLRESVRHVGADGWSSVRQPEIAALLAVVDAARAVQRVYGRPDDNALYGALEPLLAALEPFTPEPRPAGVNAFNVGAHVKDMAPEWRPPAREAPWAPPNSRDWVRDHLANAGVMVQRQFRSDQERIAELERERDEAKLREEEQFTKHGAALAELSRTRHELAEARKAPCPQDKKRGGCADTISRLALEVGQVQRERNEARRRLARVPALVWAVRDSHREYAADLLAAWEKP